MLAANAAIKVYIAPGLQTGVIVARHFVDTIDRAHFDTRLTARATVRVDHGEDFGDDFPGFTSEGGCGHKITSRG